MTTDQKEKLEQAAKEYYDWHPSGVFMAGAQTILDKPSEWGLVDSETFNDAYADATRYAEENVRLQSQLSRYRDVLERLLENNMCSHAGDELIEEALKQEEQ